MSQFGVLGFIGFDRYFPCTSFFGRSAHLVTAEPGQKARLGGRRRRSGTRHAVASTTAAHSETGQDKQDQRSKSEPETWSGDGLTSVAEVAHLVLEVSVESNVNGESDQGYSSSEEGDQRGQ